MRGWQNPDRSVTLHVFTYCLPRAVVRQHPCRCTGRACCSACANPRSHCLFYHRGRGPEGGALRQLFHCRAHCLRRWQAGDDLCRHRGDGGANGHAGEGLWAAIPAGGQGSDLVDPECYGSSEAGLRDALCLKVCDNRLRQRTCDPHLHGAAAGIGPKGCQRADLSAGRSQPDCHLSLSLCHQGDPIPLGHRSGT